MSSRRAARCGARERARQLRAGGRAARGGAPSQVSGPPKYEPSGWHVNVALGVPPVQPGAHVAMHDCPVVSVPLQPEVCGGEGAGPLLHGKGSHFFPVPPGPYPLLHEQLAWPPPVI